MIQRITILLGFFLNTVMVFPQPPSITNILVSQRTDGSSFVDIYFNLSGPANAYNISLEVSFDAGSTYTAIPTNFLSGDVSSINPGSNKHIVWDGLGSYPANYSTQTKLKLVAMAALPGSMCNCQNAIFCDLFLGPVIDPSWSPFSGTWYIHSEGLYGYWTWNSAQTDQGIILINQSQYNPNNFTATVSVKVRTGYQVGGERFVLRYSPGNQIMVSFHWSNRGIYPHVRLNGAYYFSFNSVTNFEHFNVTLGDINEYTINKTNNIIKVYVNGYLATEFIDTWFNGNTVFGLATYGTSYYRDFRICSTIY